MSTLFTSCSGLVVGALAIELYLLFDERKQRKKLENEVSVLTGILISTNNKLHNLESKLSVKENMENSFSFYQEFNDQHKTTSEKKDDEIFHFGPESIIDEEKISDKDFLEKDLENMKGRRFSEVQNIIHSKEYKVQSINISVEKNTYGVMFTGVRAPNIFVNVLDYQYKEGFSKFAVVKSIDFV